MTHISRSTPNCAIPPTVDHFPKLRLARLTFPRAKVHALLQLYDYKDPQGEYPPIKGYDKAHALRTAKMCVAVARALNVPDRKLMQYQIACLLHDLGRVGLDAPLFGKIWSWARRHNIPTRPTEWREKFPDTCYGKETEAFLNRFQAGLERAGISVDAWAVEQIEIRLGFARRLRRHLRRIKPELARLDIAWVPWMEKIMLYYYYPEKLRNSPVWVRQLAEILVACEQLEAYSNRQRGHDYYTRRAEHFQDAFSYLDSLQSKNLLSRTVVCAVRRLASRGIFDDILQSARGGPLSRTELRYLRTLDATD